VFFVDITVFLSSHVKLLIRILLAKPEQFSTGPLSSSPRDRVASAISPGCILGAVSTAVGHHAAIRDGRRRAKRHGWKPRVVAGSSARGGFNRMAPGGPKYRSMCTFGGWAIWARRCTLGVWRQFTFGGWRRCTFGGWEMFFLQCTFMGWRRTVLRRWALNRPLHRCGFQSR